MKSAEMRQEAYQRAIGNQSMTNYPAIFAGFIAKGIPEMEIKPRENVFTFNAWKAQGKSVKKGEHGVKVLTWISGSQEVTKLDGTKDSRSYSFPKSSTVFHVSQVH